MIQTAIGVFGQEYKVLRKKFAAGKKWLNQNGYVQSPNLMYMSDGKNIAHFNSLSKVWFVENK